MTHIKPKGRQFKPKAGRENQTRGAIEFLVETAESLEGLLTQIPALGISEASLLRFRLT